VTYDPLADSNPLTFKEAMLRSDCKPWWEAMVEEIDAIVQYKTWVLANLPPGKKAIPLKWIYKIKRDAKGVLEKYKARIVVRGFAQVAGLDFEETFVPVIRIESIRIIFAIATANDLHILHVDCKNASLHSKSDVHIYVTQSEGVLDQEFPDKVLRLNKSLYGLKQAPHIWYLFLCGVIVGLGFFALETDSCIYIRQDIIIEVYVCRRYQDCCFNNRAMSGGLRRAQITYQGRVKGTHQKLPWYQHYPQLESTSYRTRSRSLYRLSDRGLWTH
jgi:hypothetical protein